MKHTTDSAGEDTQKVFYVLGILTALIVIGVYGISLALEGVAPEITLTNIFMTPLITGAFAYVLVVHFTGGFALAVVVAFVGASMVTFAFGDALGFTTTVALVISLAGGSTVIVVLVAAAAKKHWRTFCCIQGTIAGLLFLISTIVLLELP